MQTRILTALAPSALALAGVTFAQDSAPPWFEEVAVGSGIDWTYVSGAGDQFWFPEVMGGGAALFDYDGDGDLDLYLVQSGSLRDEVGEGPGNKLFRNDGDWKFTDVTDEAGVGDTGYGMGVACGDYDRDGDVDLYVTNVGPNVMYENDGDGTFTNKSDKVNDARWGTSAGFFDVNGSGKLDLYVVNNLGWSPEVETPCFNYYGEPDYCSPNNYNSPATDTLYTYGRLGWNDASTLAGLNLAFGNGLGVTIGDHDLDGDLDVYVANDATPNNLWSNETKGRTVKMKNVALEGGCAVNANGTPEAGMGVQFVDLDEDGDLDLFMTHLRREKNTLYQNRNGRFRDRSNLTGMAGVSQKYTGFGMGFQDFDLDGVLDLYVANGAVQAWKADERYDENDAYAEPNHLFRGRVDGKRRMFDLVQPVGGTAETLVGTSRGAAFGDIDNDGDIDVVFVDRDARVKVLRNVAPRAGTWVGFVAVDERGRGVHSATVSIDGPKLVEGKPRRLYRQADPCYSYLCSNDPRTHFGLGSLENATGVEVRWPDGTTETFPDATAGAYHTLKKGAGEAK